MFKIYKYAKFMWKLPQLGKIRYSGGCPPRYECKQPQQSSYDRDLENMKKDMVPYVFMEQHVKDYRIFKNIFLILCVPLLVCFFIDTLYIHPEEKKRLKFREFTYLRIRTSKYPWDPVRTLFHNPKYNALPNGYEEEVPEEEEIDPFEYV